MFRDVPLLSFILVFLVTLSSFTSVVLGLQATDDDEALFLELSVVDDQSEYLDPFDMGAYDPISKTMEKPNVDLKAPKSPMEVENKPDCAESCADLEVKCAAELRTCRMEQKRCRRTLDLAHSELANQQDSPFVKHFIQGLYQSLRLDDIDIQDNDNLFIPMAAHVTYQAKEALKAYISAKNPSAELLTNVEYVLADLWQRREEPFTQNWLTVYIDVLKELVYTFNSTFDLEFWVFVVCVMPIPLGLWLMLHNHSVVKIALFYIIFLISVSWYWHWQHMYHDAMAKRQADILQLKNLPAECQDRPEGISLAWTVLRNSFMGDPCHKYQQILMVPAILEVSPTLALSETISRFVLHPLGFLGKQVSAFFGSILGNLSFSHGIIVLSVVTILIIILLLVCCGYRLDFPLWMGGIGPGSRPESTGQLADSHMLRESMTLLKETVAVMQIQQRANFVMSSTQPGSRVQEIHEFRQMTTTTTATLSSERHEEPAQSTTASSTSTPPNSLRSSSVASLQDKDEEKEETEKKNEGRDALEVAPAAAPEDDAQLYAEAAESAQIPATAGIQEL